MRTTVGDLSARNYGHRVTIFDWTGTLACHRSRGDGVELSLVTDRGIWQLLFRRDVACEVTT